MDEIKQISIEDKQYPESLKKIPDAPKILYYKGSLDFTNCFGIVGTRKPSPYGQQAALRIAGDLADAGLTIVSGLAPGIDTFVHKACVERGKKTIAVLGTGLNEASIYPQQNVGLSREILQNGGCLISELPPQSHGTKFTFPKRNRIISALSQGILIIEAKEKSGSLITANYAKTHQKKLFAVPGQIFSSNAKGPNRLIKEGATLVESAKDILDKLGFKAKISQQTMFSENPQEKLILQTISQEPVHIDAIIQQTKLQPNVVATTLALMEISGKIRNLGNNIYGFNHR